MAEKLITDLYEVKELQSSTEGYTAEIMLNEAHDIFKGHFPDNPILPGVCTLQIVEECLERAVDQQLELQQSSNIKFLSIINPFKDPELQVVCTITHNDLGITADVKVENHGVLAMKARLTYKSH